MAGFLGFHMPFFLGVHWGGEETSPAIQYWGFGGFGCGDEQAP